MRTYSWLPVLVLGILAGAPGLAAQPGADPAAGTKALTALVGTWNGPVTTPGGTLTFVLHLKSGADGVVSGTLAVPEQGGVELPMSDIQYADGKLSFTIPAVQGQFWAVYQDNALAGRWQQGTPPQPPEGLPVTLKRGEFVAQVHPLNLSAQSFAALSGSWQGALQVTAPDGSQVTLPLVLRFETNEHAQMLGFFDSPLQNANGIPVTEVSFEGGKLLVKAGGLNAQYDAQLAGNTLTGNWTQGPVSLPLTLTKK